MNWILLKLFIIFGLSYVNKAKEYIWKVRSGIVKKTVKKNTGNRDCADKNNVSDMIKYGVNPSEIGDETILTDEDLHENISARKSSKKHRPHKSSNKKEKELKKTSTV